MPLEGNVDPSDRQRHLPIDEGSSDLSFRKVSVIIMEQLTQNHPHRLQAEGGKWGQGEPWPWAEAEAGKWVLRYLSLTCSQPISLGTSMHSFTVQWR
jgi:hypothetical protein